MFQTPHVSSSTAIRRAKPDPIFKAIEEQLRLEKQADDLWERINLAESKAKKKLGRRPIALIAWRNYSHIGWSEIERVRDEFLREPGSDTDQIQREYRDARRRHKAVVKAEADWDKRAGIQSLRLNHSRTMKDWKKAGKRLAATMPTTLEGALALLKHLRGDIHEFEMDWHAGAADQVIEALENLVPTRS